MGFYNWEGAWGVQVGVGKSGLEVFRFTSRTCTQWKPNITNVIWEVHWKVSPQHFPNNLPLQNLRFIIGKVPVGSGGFYRFPISGTCILWRDKGKLFPFPWCEYGRQAPPRCKAWQWEIEFEYDIMQKHGSQLPDGLLVGFFRLQRDFTKNLMRYNITITIYSPGLMVNTITLGMTFQLKCIGWDFSLQISHLVWHFRSLGDFYDTYHLWTDILFKIYNHRIYWEL